MTKLANIKELQKFFSVKALRDALKKGDELQACLGDFRFGVTICTSLEPDNPRHYYFECERISNGELFPFYRLRFGDEMCIKKSFLKFAKEYIAE